MFKCQYYDPKLCKWITYYKSSNHEDAVSHLGDPIIGSPTTRIRVEEVKYGVQRNNN